MLKFFKRIFKSTNEKKERPEIRLIDLDSKPLRDGDRVLSLRYGLGESVLRITSDEIFYESEETGEKVSYRRMVDASTDCQKVKKIE